jgi:putative AbiEi antitoxin of type IV toxin-antitoxin system
MESKKRTGRDRAIAVLAARQHGVVSRQQVRRCGLTDREIAVRVERGQLQPLFHATFAVGHRAITRRGRMLAAILACEDRTVLSHGSAAELLGLWDRQLPVMEVIPPDWSGRKIPGIRWHRVRLPLPDEIETRGGIPCTTASRTIVDMAGRSSWAQLRRLVEQAAIMRKLDVNEIDLVLSRGRRQGAPRLRSILTPWRGTAESSPVIRSRLEARLLPRLIEEGLPAPSTNIKLTVEGHVLEVDLFWEAYFPHAQAKKLASGAPFAPMRCKRRTGAGLGGTGQWGLPVVRALKARKPKGSPAAKAGGRPRGSTKV